MSAIRLDILGADTVAARLAGLPAGLRQRVGGALDTLSQALYARVLEKLSGEVVKPGSGRLAASIERDTDGLSASVGFDPATVPYGAALEFGASIPAQLIEAKNAKALAFAVGGQMVFAKRAMHPAFTLPEHSFLRSALAEMAPDILAGIDAAVAEAVSP